MEYAPRAKMVTPGLKILKHGGLYFIYYYAYDAYMEDGLGRHLYDAIPKEPSALRKWADEMRKKLDVFRAEHDDAVEQLLEEKKRWHRGDWNGCDHALSLDAKHVVIQSSPTAFDFFLRDLDLLYVYGIDLDNMVFEWQGYPAYHLDNMPPWSVLQQDCNINAHGILETHSFGGFYYRSFRQRTPKEFRLDISRLRAPVVATDTSSAIPYDTSTLLEEPHDILLAHNMRSSSADLCLHYAANYVMMYMHDQHRALQLFRFACHSNWKKTSQDKRELAYTIAAKMLLPLHFGGTQFRAFKRRGEREVIWWDMLQAAKTEEGIWFARKHICIALGTHLQDKANAQFHTSRLVDKIMSTSDSSNTVYGVVFSVYHCIIIRVDKAAGTFCRTASLEFLQSPWLDPSAYNWPGITPAMEVMTRIGHLRASDDVDYFYHYLSIEWLRFKGPLSDDESEDGSSEDEHAEDEHAEDPQPLADQPPAPAPVAPPAAPVNPVGIPQLPLEIMTAIANELPSSDLWTLYAFALASKMTMAATIPRLRYPSFPNGPALFPHAPDSFILEACTNDTVPTSYTTHIDNSRALRVQFACTGVDPKYAYHRQMYVPASNLTWIERWRPEAYGRHPTTLQCTVT